MVVNSTLGTTTSSYNVSGWITSKTTPDGKTIYTDYNKNGVIIRSKDGTNVTRFVYDNYGRLVQQINPIQYDSAKDGLDNSPAVDSYSDFNVGERYSYYDNSYNVRIKVDACGNKIENGYDDQNRVNNVKATVTADAGQQVSENSYTYVGNKIDTITHNGFIYDLDYDENNNNTYIKVGNQTFVNNTYHSNSRIENNIYGNGQKVGNTYYTNDEVTDIDESDWVKEVKYNDEVKFEYDYYDDGKLHYKHDLVNGATYEYIYNEDKLLTVTDAKQNSISHEYNEDDFISKITSNINGVTKMTNYYYTEGINPDNLLWDDSSIDYQYESGKLHNKVLNTGNTTYLTTYGYRTAANGATTDEIETLNNNGNILHYEYYDNGNISNITSLGKTIAYKYNELNELIREDNQVLERTITYSYDAGGNILGRTEYTYTTSDTLGQALKTDQYSYDDANWKDKLTSFDGKAITYDNIGNTLTYDGYTFTWEAGRQLAAISGNGKNITYKYNDFGIRTEKTVNGVVCKYYLDRDKVVNETNGTDNLYYTYDSSDNLVSMNLNGVEYYYIRNAQNDIIGLLDKTGTQVVSYTYDTWGKLVSISGALASTVGIENPYRYRGYRYDAETGLYYLQSRYYDPVTSRYLNADVPETMFLQPENLLSTNLYAYCNNNPVNFFDPTGFYAAPLVLPPSLISSLSGALAGIMTSISVSMASVKAAIATSWFPIVCIAATAIAITGIVYTVNRVRALSASASRTIAAVQTNVKSGGLDRNKLRNNTVYIITRKGTADVVYVGRTCNYNARKSAHKPRFPESSYTMMPIATNLTLAQARALEQTIITAYGLDTLENMINSISPGKWGKFKTEFSQMETLIKSFFDPE
jgi:RHS repeat-associated protein